MNPRRISPENLFQIRFAQNEVLENPQQIKQRKSRLQRAVQFCNATPEKVKLTIKTVSDVATLEAKVLAVTEKYVVLRGNRLVPRHAIMGISMY